MSLLDAIPIFARLNKMVRANILSESKDDPEFMAEVKSQKPIPAQSVKHANLITSEVAPGMHKPILDIDFDAKLVPSTTSGHWHLYLDKTVAWNDYVEFLEAAAKIGIIQEGILKGAKERGWTSVRMPHVNKHKIEDNVIDIDDFLKKGEARKKREALEAFTLSSGFSKEKLEALLDKVNNGMGVDQLAYEVDLEIMKNFKPTLPVSKQNHTTWVHIGNLVDGQTIV